jgi:hypothetical protein
MWLFLTKSKDPPLAIIEAFLRKFGHKEGGSIRTDQGGELVKFPALADMVPCKCNYVFEPTGADSPSQKGAVEIYNDKLVVCTCTLLYDAKMPEKYWSLALLHAVYLNNCLVHTETWKTPFEGFYGKKPEIEYLKTFGSRVCVKCTGHRQSKLNRYDFAGIFLGYTASDHDIWYLDLELGIVKESHHAVFDEAWYTQPHRPPAAQLLYDHGLEAEDGPFSEIGPEPCMTHAPYPPVPSSLGDKNKWAIPSRYLHTPLPLRCTEQPTIWAAAAARTVLPIPDKIEN